MQPMLAPKYILVCLDEDSDVSTLDDIGLSEMSDDLDTLADEVKERCGQDKTNANALAIYTLTHVPYVNDVQLKSVKI